MDIDWRRIVGFEWDDGNRLKSEQKHGVTAIEAEQMFANEPLYFWPDVVHGAVEQRFQALGRSHASRLLFAAFTLRADGTLIRIISARDMKARERSQYEQET